MRRTSRVLVAIFIILLILSLNAQAGVRKGPYLMYGGDPARMTVLWQLDTSEVCTVRWGLTADYSSGTASIEPHGDTQYEYTISGLLPGTLYYYQVDGVGSGSFRAAPEYTATSVKLFAFSDPQGYPNGFDGACATMIDLFTRDPSFQTLAICGGDRADYDDEVTWDSQYFSRSWENILRFLAQIPVAGPRGNHESAGTVFRKYYPYPYVGDFYWSFDYGPVHIVVLDQFVSYAPGSPQYEWLVGDLSATSKPWKIVTFHKPGWSAGNVHGNEVEVQQYIQPLCLQYGIDLAISGHNHYYARADVGGVQHLTTGGASDYFSIPAGGDYLVTSEGAFHHLEIDIQGREASVTARRRDGSVIETFTISHGASIRVMSPESGSTLVTGETANVRARVIPAGGTCTGVHFYADGQLIGTDDTEPYEAAWTAPHSPASVSLVAEAFITYLGSTEIIASAPVSVTVTNPPPQSLNIRVSQSTDDAEESASGSMYLNSTDLELVYDGSNQKVGIRFNGIAIPQGATVLNAYVQFKVDEISSESTSLTIQGENADQANTFAGAKGNISSRPRTAAAVSWNPDPWTAAGSAGASQRTPDIAYVVQQIINRPGWHSGNSLAIIITGTGHRTAVAYDGEPSGTPLLHLEFSVPARHAPVAAGDSYSTNEDTAMLQGPPGVLTNDNDQDGDTITAALDSGPSHGTLTLNANGSFTYTPVADYNGPDSFSYHANDGGLSSNTATVTITVTPVNDAAVAAADSYTVAQNTTLTIGAPGVLANDTDVDGNTLTAVRDTLPSHGTVVLNSDGSFSYTPDANYSGPDSFGYHATDGSLNSNAVTVSIGVSAVNRAPAAVNDGYAANEDTPLTIPAPGVLSNDSDPEGNTLTAVRDTLPSHGTVVLNGDGSFTYTPAANYNGPDSFTYHATDGTLNSNSVTVSISVSAVNDAPVASNDAYTTNEDALLTIPAPGVLSNDSDLDGNTLTAVRDTLPSHGTVVLNGNGSLTYTPAANYNGPDSFSYHATDGSLNSNAVTVSIGVSAVNDAPVAFNDAYTTNEDVVLTVPAPGVLSNDFDLDSTTVTAVLTTGPSHGSVVLNPDGSYMYTPVLNYNGADSFTYRTSDGGLSSVIATVIITITPVNDSPVAAGDTYSTNQGKALTISVPGVLANDTDVDGNTLTAMLDSGTSGGVLTLNANGSFIYTPNPTFAGTDSFNYHANDGATNSSSAMVRITVQPAVNEAPVVHAGPDQSVVVSQPLTLNGSATDDGLPNGSLTITWKKISGPGTVQFLSSNKAATTATFGKVGSYTLRLTASDGVLSASDDVIVTVRKK